MEKDTEGLVQKISGRGENLLHQNISSDEKIMVKLPGAFGQAFVLTNKRMYLVKWGFMTGNTFGGQCLAFEYKNITGVKITNGMMTGVFQVITAGNQNTEKSYWGAGPKGNAIKADDAITYRREGFKMFQQATNMARELINQAHTK